jgi:HEAT repeat protein
MIGEAVLDPDNVVFKEFAAAMKLHDIAAVTFQRGVQPDELARFFGVISKLPKDVSASGGIEAAFSRASLQHVSTRRVDYSQFCLTDEAETSMVTPEDKSGGADQIWQDFISHFMSGTLSPSEEGVPILDLEKYSPVQLAKALNSGQVGTATALNTYDRIVSRHLRYTTSKEGPAGGRQGGLGGMNLLLQELSPELRRQFLSVTFSHCAPGRNIPEAEALLQGLPRDFVVEMLLQASKEGKEISPSLLSLVQKITNIDGIGAGPSLADTSGVPVQISREKLQQLFKREDYENFVVPEYDAMLQHIVETPRTDPDAAYPMDSYLETLQSPHLDIQIARVVMVFLETAVSREEYKDYADQLLAAMPALIKFGAFEILLVIFRTFSRHQREKSDVNIRSAAEAALERMKSPELVTKSIRMVDRMKTPDDGNGHAFLIAMGAVIVPEAVSILAARESPVEDDPLHGVLGNFRKETISEVKKRLKDTRFHVVNNMLLLLQALNAKEATALLRPFLDHSDVIVRMQALKTLLDFRGPGAAFHLRRGIQSHRLDISSRAIDWAGEYRVQEVVPDLLSKTKRIAIFRSDLYTNEKIIRALGMIGDPSSVDPLVKLVDRAFTLYRKQLVRMRRALFESLEGYPYSAVISLIKTGYRSRDREIRHICRKIRKQFEETADT